MSPHAFNFCLERNSEKSLYIIVLIALVKILFMSKLRTAPLLFILIAKWVTQVQGSMMHQPKRWNSVANICFGILDLLTVLLPSKELRYSLILRGKLSLMLVNPISIPFDGIETSIKHTVKFSKSRKWFTHF